MLFVFQLPEARAEVPASSERYAREVLSNLCYKGAPVASWPLVERYFVDSEGTRIHLGRSS
jgi:hypothetical protein